MTEPTLRFGSSGEAVWRLQQILADGGFYRGAIDGVFGGMTGEAVRAFQRARGLPENGIVGPQTWETLLGTSPAIEPSQPSGSGSRAVSLHIGLNRVDPAHYGGRTLPLAGCENDANDMERIARAQGFTPRKLLTQAATSDAVIDGISAAASSLSAGDIFLLTYAGHGGQFPSSGAALDNPEEDRLDETWVLYNRQLLDNELYSLWREFEEGIRIVVVSDSCHSGTVTRAMDKEAYYSLVPALSEAAPTLSSSRRMRALDEQPDFREDLTPAETLRRLLELVQRILPELAEEVEQRGWDPVALVPAAFEEFASSIVGTAPTTEGTTLDMGSADSQTPWRRIPFEIQQATNSQNEEEYRAIQQLTGTIRAADISATVLLLAACGESQLAQDGSGNGLFTEKLKQVWNGGAFSGTYPSFVSSITRIMPPHQTPRYFVVGAPNPDFESQKPFTIAADVRNLEAELSLAI